MRTCSKKRDEGACLDYAHVKTGQKCRVSGVQKKSFPHLVLHLSAFGTLPDRARKCLFVCLLSQEISQLFCSHFSSTFESRSGRRGAFGSLKKVDRRTVSASKRAPFRDPPPFRAQVSSPELFRTRSQAAPAALPAPRVHSSISLMGTVRLPRTLPGTRLPRKGSHN